MAFWYLERNGIPFRDLCFSFGNLPDTIDSDYYNQKLNEASSILLRKPRRYVSGCREHQSHMRRLLTRNLDNGSTSLAVRTRRLSIFQHPRCLTRLLRTCGSSRPYCSLSSWLSSGSTSALQDVLRRPRCLLSTGFCLCRLASGSSFSTRFESSLSESSRGAWRQSYRTSDDRQDQRQKCPTRF